MPYLLLGLDLLLVSVLLSLLLLLLLRLVGRRRAGRAEPVLRRCDAYGVGWKGRGWDRCPSCLSTPVRTSSQELGPR